MIKKCLFPAAGFGTRFLPATKAVPKEMLPILTKPLLQYAVEEALEAGISNMAIITGKGKRAIEDHFDTSSELENLIKDTPREALLADVNKVCDEATFIYARQKQALGLGHAILSGEPLIGDEPFVVHLADDLCVNNDGENVISQMLKVYQKHRCSIVAIEEVPTAETSKYGIIDGDLLENDNLYQIHNMVEKPDPADAPSNLAIIGRYILTPDIFNIIRQTKPDKSGEIQITDAIFSQAQKSKVLALKFQGKRFDCGSIKGYLDATNHFAKLQNIS